ncbi:MULTISPECIES: hypothetical protein [Bacillus]|uniref:hypothetical protein n=1 Tax=Bacillus TaxID=1386 RepID=UPI002F2B5D9A
MAISNVKSSKLANQTHETVPRKDSRIIQKMIDEIGYPFGHRLEIYNNYIGAWLPNGMRLTSAGIDKIDFEHVMHLQKNPDLSAKNT